MPLKLDAVALADGAADRAVAAGDANVLMMREEVIAANTDVGAIATLLSHLRQAKARTKAWSCWAMAARLEAAWWR